MEGKKRVVRFDVVKPDGGEKNGKMLVPGTRSQLESIKSFVKTTYMISELRVNINKRFTHIESFKKSP